jgi:hypothetical protein
MNMDGGTNIAQRAVPWDDAGSHGVALLRQLVRDAPLVIVASPASCCRPYALLYNLIPALKPGARVGIVDTFRRSSEHGTPPSLLRCELAAVGYREIILDRLTGSDAYLAIFAPPSVASRTRPEAMVACKAS